MVNVYNNDIGMDGMVRENKLIDVHELILLLNFIIKKEGNT